MTFAMKLYGHLANSQLSSDLLVHPPASKQVCSRIGKGAFGKASGLRKHGGDYIHITVF
jgi:hypothetical protein